MDQVAPIGRTVPLDASLDLEVIGDVVRVVGPVSAPGRSISIACRVLEFTSDSRGAKGSISTDGKPADQAVALTVGKATSGAPGTHSASGIKQGATTAAGSNGWNGNGTTAGSGHSAAEAGGDGDRGGAISITCDQLVLECNITLSAKGGKGSNGINGQDGGNGGNGVDGLTVLQILNNPSLNPNLHYDTSGQITNNVPPEQAIGGAGGDGGDGGKGGNGGAGGSVTVICLGVQRDMPKSTDTAPTTHFTISVSADGGTGGNGGDLGFGGNGGRGGNAGIDSCIYAYNRQGGPGGQQYSSGGAGGDAGARGLAGVGGTFGAAGTTAFHVPAGAFADAVTVTLAPGANGTAGGVPASTDGARQDGRPGIGGAHAEATNPGYAIAPYGPDGKTGGTRTAQTPQPDPPKPPSANTATTKTTSYAEIALSFPVGQLRMSLERIATYYLLTNVSVDVAGVNTIRDTLDWLKHILGQTPPGDLDAALRASLLHTATGLSTKLRRGRNAFGEGDAFGALGQLNTYSSALSGMVNDLVDVEAAYHTDIAALVAADKRKNYLDGVQLQQASAVNAISDANKNVKAAIGNSLGQLNVLSAKCANASDALQDSMKSFEQKIQNQMGLSLSSIVSLLTNLSLTDAAKPLQTDLMGAGQVIDIANQAINDVATDSGGTESRHFVIQRMMALSADVGTFTGLNQAASGFISSDGNELALLMSTRQQIDSICEDFYNSIPEARVVSDDISAYVDLATNLNAGVEEFNSLITELFEGQAQLAKVTAQSKQTAALLTAGATPDLPVMASFATALYTRTRADCVLQMYMASCAYALQALDGYDVFQDMLGRLLPNGAKPNDVESAALQGGLIEIASKRLTLVAKATSAPEPFVAAGDRCRLVLTPDTEPLLFSMLKAGQTGTFTVAPALIGDGVDQNPFAGKCNVRLTAVRCYADGLVTTDGIRHVELTHSGVERFVLPTGRQVVMVHGALTLACEFNTATNSWIEGNEGGLDADYQMIGPFTDWLVTLDYNKLGKKADGTPDLDSLVSLTVEFDGVCHSFASHAVSPS